jgi:hypothetical protein
MVASRFSPLPVTAARTPSARTPARALCLHITAMFAEAVDGVTGNEPFAPILTTFKYTLFNEHEYAQMSSAKHFCGFHDRYGFFCVGSFFHSDVSNGMNCPAYIGHLPCSIILRANRKGNLPVALETGFPVKVEGQSERSWKRRLPKTGAGCITDRHYRFLVSGRCGLFIFYFRG